MESAEGTRRMTGALDQPCHDGTCRCPECVDPDGCQTCGGLGYIVVCPDDLCHGQEECIHGDGEVPCPDPHCDAL